MYVSTPLFSTNLLFNTIIFGCMKRDRLAAYKFNYKFSHFLVLNIQSTATHADHLSNLRLPALFDSVSVLLKPTWSGTRWCKFVCLVQNRKWTKKNVKRRSSIDELFGRNFSYRPWRWGVIVRKCVMETMLTDFYINFWSKRVFKRNYAIYFAERSANIWQRHQFEYSP